MTIDKTHLWAKSRSKDNDPPPTVLEHCLCVREAGQSVLEIIAPALSAMSEELSSNMDKLLEVSCLLHDLLKGNSSFQEMVQSVRSMSERQPVRHEVLAAVLLSNDDSLGRWFNDLLPSPDDRWAVIWAIAGHHLKMPDPATAQLPIYRDGGCTAKLTVFFAHDDIRDLLAEVGLIYSKVSANDFRDHVFDTADDDENSLREWVRRYINLASREWKRLSRDSKMQLKVAHLKALLMAADAAGSALPAEDEKPDRWVPRMLNIRLHSNDLTDIITKGTKGNPPLPFQTKVGESKALATIVVAGCGNGKTTAAYLWSQHHALGRKLWFTYPTTGTASAGYEGYLNDHPDLLTALIHGRAAVDLLAMRGNDGTDVEDTWVRMESLRAWGQKAVVCTVDTVLGLMQSHRRPLYAFPAIMTGALVFDEIHSYDELMFGSLLRFLTTFRSLPVLLMSASISPGRMAKLREALGERLGEVIRGDPKQEGFRRYRLESRLLPESCQEDVTKALNAEKKVLWVCNTVGDAIKLARWAMSWSGLTPIVYHSRFRYRDRVGRQTKVIEEFAYHSNGPRKGYRVNREAALVIATQVCEMSLDICADLLVTAECPLPSFVQRLGRLNRYADGNDPWQCLVYPFQGDPYNEKPELIDTHGDYCISMKATREAVRELAGLSCSQKDLADRLDRMMDSEIFPVYSAWLDDGWISVPAPLRKGGSTVTLIREEDLEEIARELGPRSTKPSKWTAQNLVPWTIPMLFHRGFKPIDQIGGYPVVSAGSVAYCLGEGATWARNDQV